MDSLSGARVLVTGASGFIGSHLTRRLVDDGADVHALTSAVSSVYPTRLVDLRDDIVLHEGNLNDQGAMRALARAVRPEYVFHLGAYTHVGKSWQRVDECVQVNVISHRSCCSSITTSSGAQSRLKRATRCKASRKSRA